MKARQEIFEVPSFIRVALSDAPPMDTPADSPDRTLATAASRSVAAASPQPPARGNSIKRFPMTLPSTCHHAPWALVRRNGDTAGKRLSTRMAYLTDTIAGPDRHSVALRGYIMRNDMTSWTKHPRRIEWCDVIKTWRWKPTTLDVQKVKARLPIAAMREGPTTASSTDESASTKEEQPG
jgi:hypothetical protein